MKMRIFDRAYGKRPDKNSIFVGFTLSHEEDLKMKLQAINHGVTKCDLMRGVFIDYLNSLQSKEQLISELVSKALATWRLEILKYKKFQDTSHIKEGFENFVKDIEFDLSKWGIDKEYIKKVVQEFKQYAEIEKDK